MVTKYSERKFRIERRRRNTCQRNEMKIMRGLLLITILLVIVTRIAVVIKDSIIFNMDVIYAEATSTNKEYVNLEIEELWKYIQTLEFPIETQSTVSKTTEIEIYEIENPRANILEIKVSKEMISKTEVTETNLFRTADTIEISNEQCTLETENLKGVEEQFNNYYYNPTDEEREMAYKLAFSEAGIEESFGQTLVINVAINNMMDKGYSSIIEEFISSGRYSSVINGVPSIQVKREDGTKVWTPVTDDMLSDELKEAVNLAFERDYSEDLLKEVAEEMGLDSSYYEGGALYFYAPKAISEEAKKSRSNIKVDFQYGRHVFYRIWDK